MAATGSAGTYAPNRKKNKKKGRKVTSPLRPTGTPAGSFTGINPFAPGGIADQRNRAALEAMPSTKAAHAAAAPPTQPLDPDVVNQQVIGQRDVAISDLYGTWQQANLDQEYGFGAGGAASPYSQAAMLQENYKRDVIGTTSNAANAGQYNTGAYGARQNENARNYSIGYDRARRGYDAASGNLQFGRLQTYANAGTGIDEAKFKSLLDALRGL